MAKKPAPAIKTSNFSSGRKQPNPKHHNYNRVMPWITRISNRIAWLQLTTKGCSANMMSAVQQIHALAPFGEDSELTVAAQSKLNSLLIDARTLAARCKDLADELKELNSQKRYMK